MRLPINFFLFALLSGVLAPPVTQRQTDPEARAREIVGQMTLDEKISQLHGIRDETHYRYVPPVPRLGIPAFHITNGPAGAGPDGAGTQRPATALPAPIALAATWDLQLAHRYGEVAGSESRMLGNDLLEAPTINIARVPQNGRTFEGYGEDPFLAGQISVQVIQGIQSQGIIANVKHFAANNQETDRFVVNELIDERTLREIYFPAFEVSIHEGKSASVMCAYPKVNGFFSCESDFLLTTILRKDWHFDGFITSDFGAVHSTVPSVLAGLDLEMPTGKFFDSDLKAAVQSGQVAQSLIDDMLIRRFKKMIEFGMFDPQPSPQPIPARENGEKSRVIAEEGMVLLKNSAHALPLETSRLKSIALIGPYAIKAAAGGGGSSHVIPLYTVDPLEGIRSRAGSGVNVSFADGSDVQSAATIARAADVAIVMVGEAETEGRDHPIALTADQDGLVEAIVAANPRTIVVLKSGSAVLMPWEEKVPTILEAWFPGEEDGNAVAAVLFGDVNPSGKLPLSFPKNLADVAANTPEQYPGIDKTARYSEGVFVGYRHFDAHNIAPLFPFGHGLSYTTFAYSNLHLSKNVVRSAALAAPAGPSLPTITVTCDVANTGTVEGAEVVQLYVGIPGSSGVPQPPKQLKGFQKVQLKPGQKAHVRFTLDARAFCYWDVGRHGWAIAPGKYSIMPASSSRDVRLHDDIEITSSR
ncbi:MAG TPA: glycoside hydrolase family 3 C-terminal domain-containing protein [Candidatus Acidoferrales bacterium]|nr:glycoside hydrolase family 3 C-terminal domain-containing protein [Candidatus Acidoferrales bacterium]